MGSHYDELQMSCIMTADALTAYFDPNGEYYQNYRQRSASNVTTNDTLLEEPVILCDTGEISWDQNDTTLGISPHYLTKDNPFLISNREGQIPKVSL